MKIAFRTDASGQIGNGHFMRCFTLADELKKQGVQIRFISRNLPTHLSNMLNAKELEFLPLSTNVAQENSDELAHAKCLGTSQTQDALATIQALADHLWDWIIVDHYALDERWEAAVRASTKQLMVIDDLADRRHDCDLLLDQNLGRDECDYRQLIPNICTVLAGPRYALIREEFWQLRDKKKVCNKPIKNILIFFSGMDADNYTGRAVEILSAEEFINVHVDVVIGAENIYKEKIKLICCKLGFSCHLQTTRMAELMYKSDLYIGAGGGAILERIMMKLPSVTIAMADNQIKPLKFLNQTGACIYLGCGKSLSDALFKQAILQAIEVIEFLTQKSEDLCEEYFSGRIQWLEKLLIKQSG